MPETFGRYNLIEPLGEEDAAIIYKAYDTENDCQVQVKIIQSQNFSLDSMQLMRQRFECEIKSIAKLAHPNILEILDHGELKGRPFIVLPWMDGSTMQQRIKERKQIPWNEALSLMIPVTEALAYAHADGIFHRDIKPENLFVTRDEKPLLMNFHSSEILGNEATLDPFFMFLGTPAYMAPELGNTKTVDARSEIYALGIVFYEMITGRTPFTADTSLALMLKHVNEPLPEPRAFVAGLPKEVEKVIFKALAKNPSERYQSMNEFAMGLKKLEVLEALAASSVGNEVVGPITPAQIPLSAPTPVQEPATSQIVIEKSAVAPPELPYRAPVQTKQEPAAVQAAAASQAAPLQTDFPSMHMRPNIPPPTAYPSQIQSRPRSGKAPLFIGIGIGLLGIVMTIMAITGGFDRLKSLIGTDQALNEGTTAGLEDDLEATEVAVGAVAGPIGNVATDETLRFNGQQWGEVIGWNPYSSSMNNTMAISQQDNSRVTMFETPYMFNMLDGKMYPLLADGPWSWNSDMTEITFKIKPAAHWSDGTPVTAEDVAYTWASNIYYMSNMGYLYVDCIDNVEAIDELTVVVKAKLDANGKAINPLQVVSYLSTVYVVQKTWTQKLEERSNYDSYNFLNDTGEDVVSSGPYTKFSSNSSQVVLIRDENYWGQDSSMWGTLPAPKYLEHTIYYSNQEGFDAFKAGEVDVSQQYISNVQDLWLNEGLPVSTYLREAPYHVSASLPTAFFNLSSIGLDDVNVRKAIAMAVDYDKIITNAMSNQSPTFTQVPRSLMNPTPGEQALYDHKAVEDLQWVGNDIAGANALLDNAGIVDSDGDGWREYFGQEMTYNAVCPNGWNDWQAAMEVVAASGQKIGINITTYFPEWSEYTSVFPEGKQSQYDIFMVWSNGAGPTNPWGRIRNLMSSEYAHTSGNWNGNWGGYVNPRIDEIIAEIPKTTDKARLKDLYTEATEIYLTDVPSFTLMYRPQAFHTVYESVWTDFPNESDGLNIPPLDMTDGYGIAGLYHIRLVNP